MRICAACRESIASPASTILPALAREGFDHELCETCAKLLAPCEFRIANLVSFCYQNAAPRGSIGRQKEITAAACRSVNAFVESGKRVRGEGVEAARDVLAQQAIDSEMNRMVRRRMCEQVFVYRIAEWLRGDLLNAPIPLANAITDLLACGEPWQHPDFQITPPAKEESK